jgi:NitT/TauT family transport system ATP-binding protein
MNQYVLMVQVEGVSKIYRAKGGNIQALSDVTFSVARGEFVSIIGPSGCGKTTIIKIIGSLIEASGGHVSVDGLTPEEARLNGAFSFVFQNPVLLPWRNVIENVRLPLEIVHHEARDPLTLLRMVGLEGFQWKYPRELSGGMQQRVALARALTFDPKVLLTDEPFGALDEFTRNELNSELLRIWKETKVTIIFVTHSISEALFLSDRIIVLTRRPARVARTLKVPFERPRLPELKESQQFQELVKCLRSELEAKQS